MRPKLLHTVRAALCAAAAVTAAAGCAPMLSVSGGDTSPATGTAPYTAARQGVLAGGDEQTFTPAAGTTFTGATLTGADGTTTELAPGPDGAVRTGALPPHAHATVTLRRGSGAVNVATVTTGDADPDHILTATVTPDGDVRGVGTIITAHLSAPVADADKAAVAAAITTDGPPGRWHWVSDDTALYRPETFWPAHTTVTTTTNLGTVAAHTPDGTTLYGNPAAATTSWATGDATIFTVDLATHQGTATRNGTIVRTFGISGGKPGYETTGGIKTILGREAVAHMTNAGVTDEFYDLQVPWSMRITDTGEYLHSASWNNLIGEANTSHGCTNLTVDDAEWIYRNSNIGDVVVTTGSSDPVSAGNGEGSWWNVDWNTW